MGRRRHLANAGILLAALFGGPVPVSAQAVICCNQLVDVGGNWIGASRVCNLGNVPPARLSDVCRQLEGCAGAASYCGADSCPLGGPSVVGGSIVDVQNQALGERIPVAGTPFALHYRSDRMGEGFANGLGGWSLDVHHAYDVSTRIFHSGGGRRRVVAVPDPGKRSEVLVPSEDGALAHGFAVNTGRHLRTIDAVTGAVVHRFAYDKAGALSAIEDAHANLTRIERDPRGVPTAIVAPGGQRTMLTVGADGYLSAVTAPGGFKTTLAYGAGGRLTALTDPRGLPHRFRYSPQGALLKDENPAGGSWSLASSAVPQGFEVALTSGLGRRSTYAIERLPKGAVRRLHRRSDGAVTRIEGAADGSLRTTHADGTVHLVRWQPDPRFGALAPFAGSVSVSTPGGLRLLATFAREAEMARPGGDFAESLTLNGAAHVSRFSAERREWTHTSPAGRTVSVGLDDLGQVVNAHVGDRHPVRFSYDDAGRVSKVSQGTASDERSTTLAYDAEGRLVARTGRSSNTMRFEYDAAGRLARQVAGDGREVRFVRDAHGNVEQLIPPGRPAHTFQYTAADLPLAWAAPGDGGESSRTSYAYNLDRQLTSVTRADGKTIAIEYDAGGRRSTLATPHATLRYQYDAATGQLRTVTGSDGTALTYERDGPLVTGTTWTGPVRGRVGRGHDDHFRIASIAINGRPGYENAYDADGLLVRAGALTIERHAQTGAIIATKLGSVTTSEDRNGFGELTRYEAAFAGRPILTLAYERDAAGRIVGVTETAGTRQRALRYAYDAAGRLAEAHLNGVRTALYAYDANGNRVVTKGPAGEITASHDVQDRLLRHGEIRYRHSAGGELLAKEAGGKVTGFDYDALGNLRKVTPGTGSVVEYVVDGSNRRIGKKVDGRLVQGFLYRDQLRPVAELDAAGNVVRTFVHATRVNVADYFEKDGASYRIVTDHLGSPRLVVDSASGEVLQEMEFDAFGNVLRDTNPGFQPFGFAGGLLDSDTALTRFMARDYDALTGRWTTKDPLGFAGGTPNLYAYAGNDPVNRADPRGLQEEDTFGIWDGPNWSDPGQTTVAEIDSAGNVSISNPDDAPNPVDFPLTGGPTRGPSYVDRLIDRSGKGWTLYDEGRFRFSAKGPGLGRDRFTQEDVPPGQCRDSWTGRTGPQNPNNMPATPGSGGIRLTLTF